MKYTPRQTIPGQTLGFHSAPLFPDVRLSALTFGAKGAGAISDYHRCGCWRRRLRKLPECYPCSLLELELFHPRSLGLLTKRVICWIKRSVNWPARNRGRETYLQRVLLDIEVEISQPSREALQRLQWSNKSSVEIVHR
jgi:hypothetical protein